MAEEKEIRKEGIEAIEITEAIDHVLTTRAIDKEPIPVLSSILEKPSPTIDAYAFEGLVFDLFL